jgi:HAD superfamily hydrolase (TIGR01509 family)
MAKLETPKLAIFDLGNVVFQVDWEPMFQIWSESSNVSIEQLRQNFKFDENFEAFERAVLTPEEFYKNLCRNLNANFSYSDFVRGWNAIYQNEFVGIDVILNKLKSKLELVAFTNTNEVHSLIWPERYKQTLSHFKRIFSSSEIGIRKPKHEGFYYVLNNCGFLPEETIFFDDLESNIRAASSIGIRSVLVDSVDAVKNSLFELELLDQM